MQISNRPNGNTIAAAIPIAALQYRDAADPASKTNKIHPQQLQRRRTACIFNVYNPRKLLTIMQISNRPNDYAIAAAIPSAAL